MSHEGIGPTKRPLAELLKQLVWSIATVIVMFVVSFYFADQIHYVLSMPYLKAAGLGPDVGIVYPAPQEWFFFQLKIAFFGALFLALPIVASQFYSFIARGLYQGKLRAFLLFLMVATILALIGACLAYFLVLPMIMKLLVAKGAVGSTLTAELKHYALAREFLGFNMTLIFAFGLAFHIPVILTLLRRTRNVKLEPKHG
ncbi:twin-arginine translocase subunit TatC [uncultured Roseibium sp.]|uniref:twin-arginine translocase subunit TatC n=1 Tax=uncultured Roseibium sp. TaxID=1936171 RepID=UPI00321731F6